MQMRSIWGTLLIMGLALSGCGGQTPPLATSTVEVISPTATSPSESAVSESIAGGPGAGGAVVDEGKPMSATALMTESVETTEAVSAVARPAWQLLPLTNAQTGESFTLADFAGKTVYVEPFATWCTNCRQQLTHVNQVRANFGEDVVFLALSVEPNIGNDVLAKYASDQGFGLLFAAMSPDLLRELVALQGQTITNPPSTPHFIIRADGSTTALVTGIESPEAITSLIQSAQN